VCGLPASRELQDHLKRVGNLPSPAFLILVKVGIIEPQWHPTAMIQITRNERTQKYAESSQLAQNPVRCCRPPTGDGIKKMPANRQDILYASLMSIVLR
jgi:hypothetical protein